jgi:hypothetical protein
MMLRSLRKPRPTLSRHSAKEEAEEEEEEEKENVTGCRKYGLYLHIKVTVQTI